MEYFVYAGSACYSKNVREVAICFYMYIYITFIIHFQSYVYLCTWLVAFVVVADLTLFVDYCYYVVVVVASAFRHWILHYCYYY